MSPRAAVLDEDEVLTAVREILARTLDRAAADIAPGARLADDLGVDSLAMIDVVVSLEERFGIAAPPGASPEDLGLVTVRDVARFVAARSPAGGLP
ncbi:MAG: acyl carrier protein [Myxococcales bacterium]|nr:acyl carrier protein [Myxococcales bacterium]